MAMVYDKLGQLEEREEAAASFQKHILALRNPQDEDDPLVSVFCLFVIPNFIYISLLN